MFEFRFPVFSFLPFDFLLPPSAYWAPCAELSTEIKLVPLLDSRVWNLCNLSHTLFRLAPAGALECGP